MREGVVEERADEDLDRGRASQAESRARASSGGWAQPWPTRMRITIAQTGGDAGRRMVMLACAPAPSSCRSAQ